MPRQSRQLSNSGYYHVITRGIGKQIIFEESSDYRYYLSVAERFSKETEIMILAYCLMNNHVHLLLFDPNRQMPLLMKKIGVSYSKYFNEKYDRSGHLFQDRYRSECIEDERYLLTVFRYIMKNPQKAGICRASEYRWNSYQYYGLQNHLVDTSFLEKLIGPWDMYKEFINADENDICMEFDAQTGDDSWAQNVIFSELGIITGTELQKLDKTDRNNAIRKLKNAGLGIRQIVRLTGLSRGIVSRV